MKKIKLIIANIYIQFKSKFPYVLPENINIHNYANLILDKNTKSRTRPQIIFCVDLVRRLPSLKGAKRMFIARHLENNAQDWALYRKDNTYTFKQSIKYAKLMFCLNEHFNKGTIYIASNKTNNILKYSKNKLPYWRVNGIILNTLLLIIVNCHITQREGVLLHAAGIRSSNNKGILFVGRSGSGKSTSAKLWRKFDNAGILNDDKIIIRKIKNKFFMFSTPWFGDVDKGLLIKGKIKIDKVFFIHQASKNTVRPIFDKETFLLLYPNVFPLFWDGAGLRKSFYFCQELTKMVSCFKLGFKKDKSIISFVNGLIKSKDNGFTK